MKIWAHRGCSQNYPENTILAFEKAIKIPGLTGIELDVQLTKDGELIVLHDERVDRTTEGIGYARDYTLSEIKKLHIYSGCNKSEQIPTLQEVVELLEDQMNGNRPLLTVEPKVKGVEQSNAKLLLNIEIKNSNFRYPGIEEKVVELIHNHRLTDSVVYSTFYAHSLAILHEIDPNANLAILDTWVSDCYYKQRGLNGVTALHSGGYYIDLPVDMLKEYTVRGFFGGHLYPEKPTGNTMNLLKLEEKGVTDVFLNEPEVYL